MGIRCNSGTVPAAVILNQAFGHQNPLFRQRNGKEAKSEISQKTCQAYLKTSNFRVKGLAG
jgi:hypothetical protein